MGSQSKLFCRNLLDFRLFGFRGNLAQFPNDRIEQWPNNLFCILMSDFIRWFKFTLKPPYSIAHDNLRLAIWDTSFWTFWLKFGHKGP